MSRVIIGHILSDTTDAQGALTRIVSLTHADGGTIVTPMKTISRLKLPISTFAPLFGRYPRGVT